jgi:hypothetical protein
LVLPWSCIVSYGNNEWWECHNEWEITFEEIIEMALVFGDINTTDTRVTTAISLKKV